MAARRRRIGGITATDSVEDVASAKWLQKNLRCPRLLAGTLQRGRGKQACKRFIGGRREVEVPALDFGFSPIVRALISVL